MSTRSQRRETRTVTRGYFSDKGWTNFFLSSYELLPESLREEDVTKESGRKMIRNWITQNVTPFVD